MQDVLSNIIFSDTTKQQAALDHKALMQLRAHLRDDTPAKIRAKIKDLQTNVR